jgi:transcriptional regulator with XRE-family HTH domain
MQFNGKILRKIRKEKSISQVALCKDLNLDQSLLSKYETGMVKDPSAKRIKQFTEYLDVPYETFFAETTDEPINPKSNIPERIDVHVHIKIDWGF